MHHAGGSLEDLRARPRSLAAADGIANTKSPALGRARLGDHEQERAEEEAPF